MILARHIFMFHLCEASMSPWEQVFGEGRARARVRGWQPGGPRADGTLFRPSPADDVRAAGTLTRGPAPATNFRRSHFTRQSVRHKVLWPPRQQGVRCSGTQSGKGNTSMCATRPKTRSSAAFGAAGAPSMVDASPLSVARPS